ncbi:unnamed protein product [Psylliodes chrysocephalus]|uniref:Uncharacterized protein n=1 Tax=Psylliodes chrysocephalus TaxID=3402493 RepID=A0A9P0GD60_9CUCU|nr:unnamed protein product [Psylliodes chrysocephala]
MDPYRRNEKEQNPRTKCSILSLITFFYTFRLFKKGRKKALEDEDIYEIPSWLSSEKLGNELEDTWTTQKKKNENPSLTRALIMSFGKGILFLGIIQFVVKTVLIFVQPMVFATVVAYFQPNQKVVTDSDLYMYACILIGLNIFNSIYDHNYQQFLTEYCIRARTAVAALIYRKALKLGPLSNVTMGKIVTLITKDVFLFDAALIYVNDMWIGIIHIIVITVIIYQRIGLSVFGGMGFYLIIIPMQLFVGRQISVKRMQAAKKTDERIQLTTETLKNIKTIKMFSWENFFGDKLKELRQSEINYLSPVYYLKVVILVVASTATSLTFFLMILTYILTGHYTDAETIYYIQESYRNLRMYILITIPVGIAQYSDLRASLKRITEFLMAEEVVQTINNAKSPKVFMKHVASKIKETEVLKDVSFNLEKGVLLVTGNVGSGKSSIIKTLLGEYPVTDGQMLIDGTVSYASEEPWLFPSTIKQNILFGQEYDEKRYNEVLNVCALTVDLRRLEKGDQTIVGDGGVNFSKGQQARINLARAVYRNSDIYLLDDCLSSLDSKVNGYIFKKCIMGFLKDKIVIMVTNNINHVKQVYGNNILYVESGRTQSLEKQKEAIDKRITYYIDDTDMNYFNEDNDINENDIPDIVDEKTQLLIQNQQKIEEKSLYYEEKEAGKVKIGVYLRYYKHAGGISMLVILTILFILTQGASSFAEKALSWWVNNEPIVTELIKTNQTNTTEYDIAVNKRQNYLGIYSGMVVGALFLIILKIYLNYYFALRASKTLHKKMMSSVLSAFMSFFDKHLLGNIINRFSKDMTTMDETIPIITYETFRNTLAMAGIIYLVVSVNTIFIVPTIFLMIKLIMVQRFYIPTGRAVKRLEASTRSPMIGYLNATLSGLSAIRAYDKQDLLISEFDRHQDHFTSASYMVTCTGRFFAFSLDMISTMFSAAVIAKFIIFKGSQAGDVGLAISQAMGLTGLVQWVIRYYSELENNMTGIERVLEYTDIEKEIKTQGSFYDNWPFEGKIEYRNVSLIYETSHQKVLKNISFVINSKEKVGIVGRTGAGKSSIISTLFRLYDIEGSILIDEIDSKVLSLECLRTKMAIIPQDPILFSGSIRSNLDPKGNHADSELWTAITKVNLKTLFMNLDEQITDNGSNYSSGQRQLISLARAMVSKNKIIVLDEATANMDPETCRLLQRTIRENFSDCTVLTIAHRLNTVLDCDRVMVVDNGEIMEFDTPEALKAKEGGIFYSMIKHAELDG